MVETDRPGAPVVKLGRRQHTREGLCAAYRFLCGIGVLPLPGVLVWGLGLSVFVSAACLVVTGRAMVGWIDGLNRHADITTNWITSGELLKYRNGLVDLAIPPGYGPHG